ncbi:MAG: hypothetical protein QNJ41_00805 [Xenococcaceae cyanobacterium MO_188.B32]|nr:hypothetical protein [Xenococcaceae cyanobacterium MO_188.B32]
MTIVYPKYTPKKQKKRPKLWLERFMALVATLNLLLVFFDLSYVPLRDFWLQGHIRLGEFMVGFIESEGIKLDIIPSRISRFITQYDRLKGIVPYRDTEQYLSKFAQLKEKIPTDDLNSPEIISLLADLRVRSVEMIETNPFAEAGKSGTLEQIKNRMREHLPNPDDSAKQAFRQFWTKNYLQQQTDEKLDFFTTEIQPLIARNYYRHISENGNYVDNFGLIDFPFAIFFALEFLARTWYISRTRTNISWRDAMLWRWYDLFFFLPFWRWLRVIPVTIRLNSAQLINLLPVKRQLSQGLVAGIAEDVTEVVVIRVINQLQNSLRQGDINKLLAYSETNPYLDLNDTNEIAEIAKLIAQLMVYQVLPQIRPEAEALLEYSIEKALKQTSAYQGIRFLPGSESTIDTLVTQLVRQTYQAFSDVLNAALEEDEKFNQLLDSLVTNLSKSLATEIKAKESLNKIELLLIDLLEEIKINYVERLSAEDVEEILEQTRALRRITQT